MSVREPRNVAPLDSFVDADSIAAMTRGAPRPPPTPLRAMGGVIVLLLLAAAVTLTITPWVQTAAGSGTVVTLDPADRVQNLNVLVDGRINRWFVNDGDVVVAGDAIVEIIDVDPRLLERLNAEREALARSLDAARVATETAELDYQRQKRLFAQGLTARKDFEAAKIRHQQILAREAEARATLNKADIGVSRQSSQIVRAPRDGRIVHIVGGDSATIVKAGDRVATFAPSHVERAVEVRLSGLDAPLVQAGRAARIMFEGWPAVQFSGWPEASVGTFAGVVASVDPVAGPDGRFRALLREDASEPWPADRYLRLGSRAQAWVQLERVALGYELWRLLNRFPPTPPRDIQVETGP